MSVTSEGTNSMGQRPSCEDNQFSSSQEIPVFYGTRRLITLFARARHPSLFWARLVQSMPPSHFLKIRSNIIIQSTPVSSRWSLSLWFPYQYPVCTSPQPMRCTCLAHLILYLITRTIFGDEYKSISSLCSLLYRLLPRPSWAQITVRRYWRTILNARRTYAAMRMILCIDINVCYKVRSTVEMVAGGQPCNSCRRNTPQSEGSLPNAIEHGLLWQHM